MMSIAPYLRPDLDQSADQLPLYITGSLANAKPGQGYEGRLQIYNNIGPCTILSVTGSDVPPGGSWYVDNATSELVLQWPEYAENDAPIGNPGFESGMDGWTAGAGWSVTTNNPIDGTTSAVFKNAGGESVLSSNSRYLVNGESFSAHCKVRQGASSAGNAGGAVRVEFRNADGQVVGFKDGNRVMSASNNAVKPSDVAISPSDYPADAMTVNIAGLGIRKRQNREVWVDTFAWDYEVASAGVNIDTTLCYTVTVRDSAGRTAEWSGCVSVVNYVWDGSWAFDSTGVSSHWVAYSPTLDRFTTGQFNSAQIRYKNGIAGSWTAGASAGGMGVEQIKWLPWASIFYATATTPGNVRWSADGITYVPATGQPFGMRTDFSPTAVQNIGGSGAAQFTRSFDGKNYQYSGSSGPGGLTSPLGIAYGEKHNRFVAVFSPNSIAYNTSDTTWVSGGTLPDTATDVFYAPAPFEKYFAITFVGGTFTVHQSDTGFAGSWSPAFSFSYAGASVRGAYCPEFGFALFAPDRSWRFDGAFNLISTAAHISVGSVFDVVWEPALGKFLVSYQGGMALSNSTA